MPSSYRSHLKQVHHVSILQERAVHSYGDQKHIFPVIVENVDFSGTERARGGKYVVSGINWTICFALAMTNSMSA